VLALSLALSAAVCWGFADFLGGLLSRSLSGHIVGLVTQAFGLALLLMAVPLIAGGIQLDDHSIVYVVVAGIATAVGVVSIYGALAIGPMSIVAPIVASAVVVPVIVGLTAGDRPAPVQLIGLGIGAVGLIAATRPQAETSHDHISRAAFFLSGIAAASFGTTLATTGPAVDANLLGGIAGIRLTTVLCLVAFLPLTRPSWQGLQPALPSLALVGMADISAQGFYAGATMVGLLSLVGFVTALFPAITVIFAWIILRERLAPMQTVGLAAGLLGLAMIAAG
jgi:drug/metabolite transporter (DMT)-like permease